MSPRATAASARRPQALAVISTPTGGEAPTRAARRAFQSMLLLVMSHLVHDRRRDITCLLRVVTARAVGGPRARPRHRRGAPRRSPSSARHRRGGRRLVRRVALFRWLVMSHLVHDRRRDIMDGMGTRRGGGGATRRHQPRNIARQPKNIARHGGEGDIYERELLGSGMIVNKLSIATTAVPTHAPNSRPSPHSPSPSLHPVPTRASSRARAAAPPPCALPAASPLCAPAPAPAQPSLGIKI